MVVKSKVPAKTKIAAKTSKAAAGKTVTKAAPKKAAPKKVAVKKAEVKKAEVKKAEVKKASPVKKAASAGKVAAAKPSAAQKATPKKAAPKKTKVQKGPSGFPEQLRDAALKVLDDRKALDIVAIDMVGRSAVADYAIIASGGSARALAALAEYLREAFFKLGAKRVRVEGLPQGDWVLIDVGDVLIHLFRPEVRSFYQIEDIWAAKKPK